MSSGYNEIYKIQVIFGMENISYMQQKLKAQVKEVIFFNAENHNLSFSLNCFSFSIFSLIYTIKFSICAFLAVVLFCIYWHIANSFLFIYFFNIYICFKLKEVIYIFIIYSVHGVIRTCLFIAVYLIAPHQIATFINAYYVFYFCKLLQEICITQFVSV